ncbi:unannotated protein [freshwater metagenome]|uniref:Unannotated protein n=1 Tax=freshwater metagenome TaxID=449393 RepID=A0A6J7PHL8_9ZZZZ
MISTLSVRSFAVGWVTSPFAPSLDSEPHAAIEAAPRNKAVAMAVAVEIEERGVRFIFSPM